MRRMLATLSLLSLLLGGGAQAQSAQFKGMPALSRELATRLAPPGMSLELDWFLPAPGLDDLVGTWSTFGSEHSFQNGSPNALSMVIWHVTLTNLARSIGQWCEAPPLMFENSFAVALRRLCGWPGSAAKDETALEAFWLSLMGHAAPRSEFLAWRAFFLTSSYRDKPARETIPAMALAIMLNPYFLLAR